MPRVSDDAQPGVDLLESQLKRSLRPVEPDRQFVTQLHTRLSSPPTMVLERRANTALGLLLVAGSLLSGAVLVWLLRQLRPPRAA